MKILTYIITLFFLINSLNAQRITGVYLNKDLNHGYYNGPIIEFVKDSFRYVTYGDMGDGVIIGKWTINQDTLKLIYKSECYARIGYMTESRKEKSDSIIFHSKTIQTCGNITDNNAFTIVINQLDTFSTENSLITIKNNFKGIQSIGIIDKYKFFRDSIYIPRDLKANDFLIYTVDFDSNSQWLIYSAIIEKYILKKGKLYLLDKHNNMIKDDKGKFEFIDKTKYNRKDFDKLIIDKKLKTYGR